MLYIMYTYIFFNMSCVKHVKQVKNTYYVAFSTSTCLLSSRVCGLDLIVPNKMCNALLMLGRNDSHLCFVSSTFPTSTTSFNFDFCFFHVNSVDWLKLYVLHTSTTFMPYSNLLKFSRFSLSVQSMCCSLGLEQDIFLCTVLNCTDT